jgi:hypothetical protein
MDNLRDQVVAGLALAQTCAAPGHSLDGIGIARSFPYCLSDLSKCHFLAATDDPLIIPLHQLVIDPHYSTPKSLISPDQ